MRVLSIPVLRLMIQLHRRLRWWSIKITTKCSKKHKYTNTDLLNTRKPFPQTTLRDKMCPVSLKSNQFKHLGLYRYIYFIYFHVYLEIEESEDIPFKFYCSGNVNLFPSSAKTWVIFLSSQFTARLQRMSWLRQMIFKGLWIILSKYFTEKKCEF